MHHVVWSGQHVGISAAGIDEIHQRIDHNVERVSLQDLVFVILAGNRDGDFVVFIDGSAEVDGADSVNFKACRVAYGAERNFWLGHRKHQNAAVVGIAHVKIRSVPSQ